MSQWQTIVPLDGPSLNLDHQQHCFHMGSCFAQHMQQHLRFCGFHAAMSPYGTTFHPLKVVDQLEQLLDGTLDMDFQESQGQYVHFDFAKGLRHADAEFLAQHLASVFAQGQKAFQHSQVLFVTFGSAWGYYFEDRLVNNCHKIPQSHFDKRLSRADDVVAAFTKTWQRIKAVYPNYRMVLSVSPVRHWKDGVVANQRSKAELHIAAQLLSEQLDDVFYFPSYEIVLDELRDYRFYQPDMLHPNPAAVRHIMERFESQHFAPSILPALRAIKSFRSFEAHQPVALDKKLISRHLSQVQEKREALLAAYQGISL